MTCRACGARLVEGATWCSLCFAPVQESRSANDEHDEGDARDEDLAIDEIRHDAASDPSPGAPLQHTQDDQSSSTDADWTDTGRFIGDHALLRAGDSRGWRCAVCDAVHPIDVSTCAVCGASLFSAMQRTDRAGGVSASTALVWSIVPGGGQWVVGLHLQAPARFVTIALALLAAFAFPGAGTFAAGRLLFVAVGLGLWVIAAYDARAVALERPPVLTERLLLWTSAGLLGLLIMTVMVAVVVGVSANV